MCEVNVEKSVHNVEKSVHKQFVRYLRDMDVVGGDKLEGVAEMFNLYELSRRLRPFKCINCNTWIDPVAPRVHCLVRRVRDGRCLECGEVVGAHAHTLPWHAKRRPLMCADGASIQLDIMEAMLMLKGCHLWTKKIAMIIMIIIITVVIWLKSCCRERFCLQNVSSRKACP